MRPKRKRRSAELVLLGAGLIGRHAGLLAARLPGVGRIRVIDRDRFEGTQVPGAAGRPKAIVVAEWMRAANPRLEVEPMVGDIEHLPLGLLRADVLLTCLDSRRARMRANLAFTRLGIPFWVDAGISAPALTRVSLWGRGADGACYECGLSPADYAAEGSYPCQAAQAPPPTRSPEHLGALAAALQVGEVSRVLAGAADAAQVGRELVYDLSGRVLALTRLARRVDCRCEHRPWRIQALGRSATRITLAEALELGAVRSRGTPELRVPGTLFVRGLVCPGCGEQRSVLRLQGRFSEGHRGCRRCGQRMAPLGIRLAGALLSADLSPRERALPLSALGVADADVIAVTRGVRTAYFTFRVRAASAQGTPSRRREGRGHGR